MIDPSLIIVWFRQDLRLADNPALHSACSDQKTILPVYILDDENAGAHGMGGASRVWLHHALEDLNKNLGGKLWLAKGDPKKIILDLAKQTGARRVYWNRCYEYWRIRRDRKIKEELVDYNIEGRSFNGSLLWEPWNIKKFDGTPYKVFTPYYRKGCLSSDPPRTPLPTPKNIECYKPKNGLSVFDLDLLPKRQGYWTERIVKPWDISEKGAHKRLKVFLEEGLQDYKDGRNFPAKENVSRLSPYLHFGQISPHTAWHEAQARAAAPGYEHGADCFMSELGWREFSYSMLYHFPSLPWENLQPRFNSFPWVSQQSKKLEAWKRGQTGYPIVDAAMRELWQTGYMHNRCRMIVGSFLVKHLLTHWHRGAEWFWDCLFDADLANNSASWQWIAGCGADAAPYFRIFNPVTQGEKFDPDGEYVRTYVPELQNLPDKYLHKPWEAPQDVLDQADITLGQTYPNPIVDHKAARDKALKAFEQTKKTD